MLMQVLCTRAMLLSCLREKMHISCAVAYDECASDSHAKDGDLQT